MAVLTVGGTSVEVTSAEGGHTFHTCGSPHQRMASETPIHLVRRLTPSSLNPPFWVFLFTMLECSAY